MAATTLEELHQQITQREQELERLRQELGNRQSQLSELTRQREDLQSQLREVDAAIAALGAPAPRAGEQPSSRPSATRPASPAATSQALPRLRDLIQDMLKDSQAPMTASQLCEEAQRRGYKPSTQDPVSTISARLQELKKEGIVQRAEGYPGFVLAPSANGAGKSKSKASPSATNGSPKAAKAGKKKSAGKKTSPKGSSSSSAARGKSAESKPQGKGPSLRVVLTDLLSKNRTPIGVSELADQVLATGYTSDSSNFPNVVQVMLGKMENVQRVPGEGYRLKKR